MNVLQNILSLDNIDSIVIITTIVVGFLLTYRIWTRTRYIHHFANIRSRQTLMGDLIPCDNKTGTAKSLANSLICSFLADGSNVSIAEMNDENLHLLQQPLFDQANLVLFILSTFGEGDPPDNAISFVKQIQSNKLSMEGLPYAVFGVGNSNYGPLYNRAAKRLDKSLTLQRASKLRPICLGDDALGLDRLESAFLTWQRGVLLSIDSNKSQRKPSSPLYANCPVDDKSRIGLFTGEPAFIGSFECQKGPFNSDNPFLAPIVVNSELYSQIDDRSCHLLELKLPDSSISYQPGDYVGLQPSNPDHLIDRIARLLNVKLDQTVNLVGQLPHLAKQSPFPSPCTYHTALKHYVDLNGPPSKRLLGALAQFATSPEDSSFLSRLADTSREGQTRYSEWIASPCRDIVDLLVELPTFRPPIDLLLQHLNRLKPRWYSISSSQLAHPGSLLLTISVIDRQLESGRHFKGLLTSQLGSLPHNYRIPAFIRPSTFRLPRSPVIPVVMIATGTGIAPFIAFIEHRRHLKLANKNTKFATMLLFYGCRSPEQDALYSDLLTDASNMDLLEVQYAFSRHSSSKRCYVQHRIVEQGERLWCLIDTRRAYVYVCGSATTMAPAVQSCLNGIVKQHGDMSEEAAASYFSRLQSEGRYRVDVWS